MGNRLYRGSLFDGIDQDSRFVSLIVFGMQSQKDVFNPLIINGVVTRDKDFLYKLGKVLKLNWIVGKSFKMRRSLINRILPSFACLAVKNNDFIALSELLEKTEVSHPTYDDVTALHTACELGNIDMIKFLLSKGASHPVDHCGKCPLYMAVKNRHHHAVSLLYSKGATVTKPPVTIAVEMIQAIQIKDHRLLLAWAIAGVDMDAQDYNGRTAMHEAVYLGDVFMIRNLLEYGATPLVKDVWGQTAVDDARNKTAIMDLFEPIFTVHCPTKEAYLLYEPKLSVRR